MIPMVNLSNKDINKLTKDELIDKVKELNNSIKLQEDFLLNISHDLRNPINVILSILQCFKYLDNTEKDQKNAKRRKNIES